MTARFRLISALAVAAALAGCRSSGDIVVDQGVGIQAFRSACPAVGIPDYTGDNHRLPIERLRPAKAHRG